MYRSEGWWMRKTMLTAMVASIFCVACAGALAIKNDDGGSGKMSQSSKKVRLEVVVLSYKPESMHDDFVDGSYASYDVARAEIIAPAMYKGGKLTIVRPSGLKGDFVWARIGRKYVIEVDPWIISNPGGYISPELIEIISEI